MPNNHPNIEKCIAYKICWIPQTPLSLSPPFSIAYSGLSEQRAKQYICMLSIFTVCVCVFTTYFNIWFASTI